MCGATMQRDRIAVVVGPLRTSGGPKGGHLKGGHLKMGFRTEALSKGFPHERRRLDREGAV